MRPIVPCPPKPSKPRKLSPDESSAPVSSPIAPRINPDNEEEDEELLNDSDSTPVHVGPPVHASHEERVQYYWRLCYGETEEALSAPKPGDGVWSANRQPPNKSCLSCRKQNTQSTLGSVSSTLAGDMTPPNYRISTPIHSVSMSETDGVAKNVKFGFSSAVEFDENRPTIDLTPLPSNIAQEYFPLDTSLESNDSSEAKHKETAYNISVLAEWENDFDSFLEDDEENDICSPSTSKIVLEDGTSPQHSRNRFHYQRRHRKSSDARELRRTSEYFSREGGSLLGEDIDKIDPDDTGEVLNIPTDRIVNGNTVESSIQQSPLWGIKSADNNSMTESSESSAFSSQIFQPLDVRLSTSSISPEISNSSTSLFSPHNTNNDTPTNPLVSSTVLRSVHSDGGAAFESPIQNVNPKNKSKIKPYQLESVLMLAQSSHFTAKNVFSIKNQIVLSNDDLKSWALCALFHNLAREDSTVMHRHRFIVALHELYQDNWKYPSILKTDSFMTFTSNDMSISTINDAFTDNSLFRSVSMDHSSSVPRFNTLIDLALFTETLIIMDNDTKSLVAELFDECALMLEQQLKSPIDLNSSSTRNIYELSLRCLSQEESSTIYSVLLRLAVQEWRKMELQVLWGAPSWLTAIIDDNIKEGQRVNRACLPNSGARFLPFVARRGRGTQQKYYHELQQLERIRQRLETERKALDRLKREIEFWNMLLIIETSISDRLIESLTLKNIIPFEVSTLSASNIDVIFRHLDSSITTVRITQQIGSSPDSLGIMKNPSAVILRQKNGIENIRGDKQRKHLMPSVSSKNGVAAQKLFSSILDNSLFIPFLRRCYTPDNSITWISIVCDIFDRLHLLACDVAELGRYYRIKIGSASKSECIELHVTIPLGAYVTIGVRFTFDLSLTWTLYHMAPSQVYLSAISGEPAVPLTSLQRSLERKLSCDAPISNACLLKRLCSLLVETAQGISLKR